MPTKIKDQKIKLSQIRPSPHGFRRSTSKQRIEELADSIDKIGQLNQLTVRPMGTGGRYYELLAGHRRYEALKDLGAETARCAVLTTDDDRAVLASVMENLHQQPMSQDERKRAEIILTEYYTKLFEEQASEEEEEEAPKPRAKKKSSGKDVLKRGAGRKKSTKAKVAEAVADAVGVSVKTYLRDVKQSENLIPAADKALEIKRITSAQANILVDLSPEEQRRRLPLMIQENQQAKEREAEREKEEMKAGPTPVARRMLEAILFSCKDQSVRVRDFLSYTDGKDLDYKVLRKAGLELATELAQLLTSMVAFVEGD